MTDQEKVKKRIQHEMTAKVVNNLLGELIYTDTDKVYYKERITWIRKK